MPARVALSFFIFRALLWYTGLFQLVYYCSACQFFSNNLGFFHLSVAPLTIPETRCWPLLDFQPCAGYASAPLSGAGVPPVSTLFLSSSFFLSCTRWSVRAGPGFVPSSPVAGRSQHGAPARPARGRDRWGRDQPTRRPALPTGLGAFKGGLRLQA